MYSSLFTLLPKLRPYRVPTRRHLTTLPLSHPIFTVWSSNTALGKTLTSAGLALSLLTAPLPTNYTNINTHFLYLKPVQTGFPADSDARFVYQRVLHRALSRMCGRAVHLSDRVINVSGAVAAEVRDWYEEKRVEGEGENVSKLECKTLYAWKEAVSPHLAVEREGGRVEDEELLRSVEKCLWMDAEEKEGERWCLIETAGGVASPGPSSTLQCDLYRPLRIPAILVGDGKLGGISGTISAYETLKFRGYDVVAVVLEDGGLANEASLSSYLQNGMPVLVLPPIPKDPSDDLIEWFNNSQDIFDSLKQILLSAYSGRLQRLHEMRMKAKDILWWPFTQHGLVPKEKVTVIDSRCGEKFTIHKVHTHGVLTEQFDACASWWTQGPDSKLQIELARDMGYAAARYGHVMFPENVYEPALKCAELLLEGVGKGWASRTFFSDNGSTAVEVALKMAFRKFLHDHEELLGISDQELKPSVEFRVVALSGSYHGDTLGAMEAQAPSSYTGFLQQPWYVGRGLFIDTPTVYMHHGKWKIVLPDSLQSDGHKLEDLTFGSRDEVFSKSRDISEISKRYFSYITKELSEYHRREENKWIAALIIEPGQGNEKEEDGEACVLEEVKVEYSTGPAFGTGVVHGAGGMHMVDPLYQRTLAQECRKRMIPVIFDEVFTGFWRLGVESASELLHCVPDIACYAKLLTGGIIPLSATLATESVFNAFSADSKLKALLHGHSYSAHAMGCTAAVRTIRSFKDPKKNQNVLPNGKVLKELWDAELVHKISMHPQVKRLIVLGTVFALELETGGSHAGYASTYAATLVQDLREDGMYMRPLGNVLYIMCGPCTSPHVCTQMLTKLYQRIDEFCKSNVTS